MTVDHIAMRMLDQTKKKKKEEFLAKFDSSALLQQFYPQIDPLTLLFLHILPTVIYMQEMKNTRDNWIELEVKVQKKACVEALTTALVDELH
jgi:hypothetical protein